ncbi:MAG: hypothetical protein CMF69_06085, partial [Magnetovibrio sp.]|nr:hypothetical protein [Magnetovibrio sp.]
MKPTLLSGADMQHYLDEGYWSRETHARSLRSFAMRFSNTIACRDEAEGYTWAELEVVSNHIAANLIKLGLARDSRALVRMSSSCREMVLRIALKKAGIIGVFVPMQWRQKELSYVRARTDPALLITSRQGLNDEELLWMDDAFKIPRVILDPPSLDGWLGWATLTDAVPEPSVVEEISERAFAFDEVSLITASSGTSGIAKLCEWPEAAQLCIGRSIGERLGITKDDTIGIFSPMSGAAGVLVWLVSAAIPATFVFPKTYNAPALLGIIGELGITVATTVPVIMSRLAQEPLADYNLISLRALRVGTAAADMSAARKFEEGADCRVVVAAGSMECPGFAHADFDEDREIRLNGSIGLRLPGCRSRIIGDDGEELSAQTVGELIVSAPYAASGYW